MAEVVGPAEGVAGTVALADALRRSGVGVGTGQVRACIRAVEVLGGDLADRYWAGRLSLIGDVADLPTYDRVFRRLANVALGDETLPRLPRPVEVDAAAGERVRPPSSDGPGDPLLAGGLASERERLRHRRFDQASPDELAAIGELVSRLRIVVPHRRSRRTRPGTGATLDLPRTLERALRTDGELLERAWRRRRTAPRRLVVLLDVSGSMASHARALLRFAAAARRSGETVPGSRVEVFAFATRLTRLSDALTRRDPDAAIAAAAERVLDWDGGTRIGASIDELVRVWGRRGVLRGAVVVVCSDGLERGDPRRLEAAMARLRRHAHRIVWVNPLAGDPRYEPSQRGMTVALAHVDALVAGNDLASMESLSELLGELG